jgi:hypothetical protein
LHLCTYEALHLSLTHFFTLFADNFIFHYYREDMADGMAIAKPHKEIIIVETWRKELLRGLLILLLVAVVFLFLRVLLKLVGANPENIFTGFIYLVSGIFLLPYFGILPESGTAISGRSSIDIPAFLAIFCYLLLIPLAMSVIQITCTIMKSTKKAKESIEGNEPVDTTVVDEVVE